MHFMLMQMNLWNQKQIFIYNSLNFNYIGYHCMYLASSNVHIIRISRRGFGCNSCSINIINGEEYGRKWGREGTRKDECGSSKHVLRIDCAVGSLPILLRLDCLILCGRHSSWWSGDNSYPALENRDLLAEMRSCEAIHSHPNTALQPWARETWSRAVKRHRERSSFGQMNYTNCRSPIRKRAPYTHGQTTGLVPTEWNVGWDSESIYAPSSERLGSGTTCPTIPSNLEVG